jgi:hypothetical protein
MFHGTTKKTVASANCYAGDVGGHAMSCTIDTTSLSGAITYQFQVYTDGNSTVEFNTAGPSYITIMEVTV